MIIFRKKYEDKKAELEKEEEKEKNRGKENIIPRKPRKGHRRR